MGKDKTNHAACKAVLKYGDLPQNSQQLGSESRQMTTRARCRKLTCKNASVHQITRARLLNYLELLQALQYIPAMK